MIIQHHDLEITLEDAWWEKAGMNGFTPSSLAYIVDRNNLGDKRICLIAINDVEPARRNPGVPYFKESRDEGITAEERVSRILRGFVSGAAIPPVQMVRMLTRQYSFKLTAGYHRFYCSVAAGFTHVPAIQGFDWETLDRPELINDKALC